MNDARLKTYTSIRTILIAYGTAAFSWWFSSALPQEHEGSSSAGSLFILGLVLQLALLVFDVASHHVEPLRRWRAALDPGVRDAAELLADGATVLMFAVGTFRAVLRPLAEL